jgi:hypothetical protein
VQLVADANVLLSAIIGGRAALVLRREQVEQVFTPTAAYDEVFEYLAPLCCACASHVCCANAGGVRGLNV